MDFWNVYPRRVAKKDAERAWKEIHPSLHGKIIEAVGRAKMSKNWRKADGEFIPYPATYLRGERWEDELEPDAPPAPAAPTSSAGKSLEILGRRKP